MTIDNIQLEIELAKAGITKKEAAKRAGISPQRFGMILNQKNCTPRTAGKIARALGVPVTEIIKTK